MKTEKRIKLTEKCVVEFPTLYMVAINLSGVYDKVITLLNQEDEDGMWIDSHGDECFYPGEKYLGWNIDDGRSEYISANKEDAKKVLDAILVYKNMLIKRL